MVLFLGFSTTGFGATTSDLDKNSTEIEFDFNQSIDKVVMVTVGDQSETDLTFERNSKAVSSSNDFFNNFLTVDNPIIVKEEIIKNLFSKEIYKPNFSYNYIHNYIRRNFTNKQITPARDKL
jgi:F0F1-type ATP synthase gamma subunit